MTELSDQELSKQVAESLGWKLFDLPPDYATDLAAAMGLLEQYPSYSIFKGCQGYFVTIETTEVPGYADTLPRSICIAWLAMRK